jgi:hypothetical protein
MATTSNGCPLEVVATVFFYSTILKVSFIHEAEVINSEEGNGQAMNFAFPIQLFSSPLAVENWFDDLTGLH